MEYEYEVEEIIMSCITRGQQFYLIKCKGYSSKEATWEKASHCNCPYIIKDFHAKFPKQPFLGGADVMSQTDIVSSMDNTTKNIKCFLSDNGEILSLITY